MCFRLLTCKPQVTSFEWRFPLNLKKGDLERDHRSGVGGGVGRRNFSHSTVQQSRLCNEKWVTV